MLQKAGLPLFLSASCWLVAKPDETLHTRLSGKTQHISVMAFEVSSSEKLCEQLARLFYFIIFIFPVDLWSLLNPEIQQ